jgi:hypothetical protein
MYLHDYLNSQNANRSKKIKDILLLLKSSSPECENFYENLYREYCLSSNDWNELFSGLIGTGRDIPKLITQIQLFFRNNRQLIGERIHLSPPVLGRIRSFKRFCDDLVDLGYYVDYDQAVADITYKIGMELSEIEEEDTEWKSQFFFKYILWSTFDPKGGDPFGFSCDKEEVLRSLGIGLIDDQVLLFRYALPADINPKIPTIGDAYSGDFNKYFNRVSEGSPYGMTRSTNLSLTANGKPETVHETIKIHNSTSPMRYL